MMKNKGRTDQQEPAFKGPGVSELLKTTRERAGQDLKTVADVLRIRYVYLEAIEAGRFEELPGKTYVVGFVRAYSEHLGLDSDQVVRRFKDETAGLEGKTEFVFPSPVTEQSIPGGAIILISLIILGAAYGGWYFLSSQDRSVAELVPDLPAKFAEMVGKVKETSPSGEAVEEKVEEAVTNVAADEKPASDVSEADAQEMAQKAREAIEKSEETVEAAVSSVETVKVEEKVEASVEKTEKVIEESAEKVDETLAEVKEEVREAATAVEEKVEEVVEEVTSAAAETAEVVEEAPAAPQPMTQKVVLKAVDYSWFQVVNPDGSILHTQVLNKGEEYQIPAVQGLTLRTGNAGGLEIYVDDKKTPSIGGVGDVRRKVLIDPEKLLAGSAVES